MTNPDNQTLVFTVTVETPVGRDMIPFIKDQIEQLQRCSGIDKVFVVPNILMPDHKNYEEIERQAIERGELEIGL